MKYAGLVPLLFLVAPPVTPVDARRTSSVGMPGILRELVLPGSELEAKRITDRKTPIILRIVRVSPHGTAFRYDLEYVGLEPGTFDLKEYLQRKDRSSTADLPPVRVTITSVLPREQVLPNELEPAAPPRLGGYWLLLTIGAIVWILGLLAILFVGRKRRQTAAVAGRPKTLAEHLRPLVEEAVAGRSDPTRLADLERALITYWTKRLGLYEKKPVDALPVLRQHAEAGPLLRQLEVWLHQRQRPETIDVAALLAPYRNLPADALEAPS
jgi:hypothetical protein